MHNITWITVFAVMTEGMPRSTRLAAAGLTYLFARLFAGLYVSPSRLSRPYKLAIFAVNSVELAELDAHHVLRALAHTAQRL